jgi:hypothetical protein
MMPNAEVISRSFLTIGTFPSPEFVATIDFDEDVPMRVSSN